MNTNELPALPQPYMHFPPKKPQLARVDFFQQPKKSEKGNGWITVKLSIADRERQAGEAVAWREAIAERVRVAHDVSLDGEHSASRTLLLEIAEDLASLPAPQGTQAGWKLVPVEPTREMLVRGWSAYDTPENAGMYDVYRAMLAAAPSPDGKAERIESAWQSHGGNDTMRHPEASDLVGGETDMPRKAEQAEAPSDADMASPEYRAGWNAGIDLMTRAMLRATHPTASNAGEREDAARFRHLCAYREVMLLTTYFGNGCVNKNLSMVLAKIDAERAALSTQPPQGGQKPKTAEEMRPDFEWWWVTRSVFPALGTREAAAAWAAWVASGGYTAPDGWQLSDAPWGWEAVNSAPQPEQVAQDTVDAERYRWLREADPDEGPFIAEVLTNDWGKSNPCAVHQEAADKRIDAARARGDGGGL